MRGGTDFEEPLRESCRLISEETFDNANADVIFITDGICAVSDKFAKYFTAQKAGGFTVRGILLGDGAGESLARLCDRVYRLGELGLDGIAARVIGEKVA
jgi:uncharacterized protein with von Willebrand factor type A (vWA) domain